jgi:hypothetical protein
LKNKQLTVLTNASLHLPGGSVADPRFGFNSDPDPAFNANADPVPAPGFYGQKLKKLQLKKIIIF